jgi:predicted CopG family antitoxin
MSSSDSDESYSDFICKVLETKEEKTAQVLAELHWRADDETEHMLNFAKDKQQQEEDRFLEEKYNYQSREYDLDAIKVVMKLSKASMGAAFDVALDALARNGGDVVKTISFLNDVDFCFYRVSRSDGERVYE